MSLIPLLVMVPLGAALLIALDAGKVRRLADAIAVASAFIGACLAAVVVAGLGSRPWKISLVGGWPPPLGIPLVLDGLSALLLVTTNAIVLAVALYATAYMRRYTDKWKFHTLFMLMVAGTNGLLLSGDLFNLYVFLELSAICGYFLVAFGTDAEGLEASFKYAVMGAVASCFILLGLAFLYGYVGTLNIAGAASALAEKGLNRTTVFIAALFIMGFGLKAALAPFHAWLPYAHSSAPAPVSAMLSAVSIKALGIYCLARVLFNVFGMNAEFRAILAALAVLSMLGASFLAFAQTDIKRLFAYSSISQIGFIALGLAVGTPLALFGALFHLFAHSVSKALLFLGAGSIEEGTGTRDLSVMRSVIRKMPLTGYGTLFGAFSVAGMPPFMGFWSKLVIIFACLKAGHPLLAFIAVISSILTLGYYFRALGPALFGGDDGSKTARCESPLLMTVPIVVMAFVAIAGVLIFIPGDGFGLFERAAGALTRGTTDAIAMIEAFK